MSSQWFPSPSIIFKLLNRHPFVSYRGEELKIPLSEELSGLDRLNLSGNKGFILVVSDDETELVLTNVMDGGEF